MLCRIVTFMTGYVTLVTFIKGYVTLWYLSRFMSLCYTCKGLCRIVMFINVHVSVWCYWGLYRITIKPWFVIVGVKALFRIVTFMTGYVTLATFIKGYVTLWYLSRVMSHCHTCQGLCRIVMFINVDISVWCYRGLYRITIKHWFVTVGI